MIYKFKQYDSPIPYHSIFFSNSLDHAGCCDGCGKGKDDDDEVDDVVPRLFAEEQLRCQGNHSAEHLLQDHQNKFCSRSSNLKDEVYGESQLQVADYHHGGIAGTAEGDLDDDEGDVEGDEQEGDQSEPDVLHCPP